MNENRILIVSNRLPFQITEKNGRVILTQSTGGLVSSMVSYFQQMHGAISSDDKSQWIGVSDFPEARFADLQKEKKMATENFELNPVYIPPAINDGFYNGFCNNTIWPLFHYFPSYTKFSSDHYEKYVAANKLFCDKVVQTYRPGDLIWIHDYHLMLLPGLVREVLPEATIGFFLHIPFPSFELFRVFPGTWKKQLLNGLLGADLIGFHTNDYMQHFLKSVQQVLGYDISLRKVKVGNRSVTVDTNPVSIDFNKFYNSSNEQGVYDEINKIKKQMAGKQIIISVDRLDYAKAIPNRLEGFDLFLKNHPEYKGKVTYILVVVPSRDIITRYKENKREIELLVSGINGKYGTISWTPVVYQYTSIDFKSLTALYFAADAALITPLRDGMNLVAKEFVSTRLDKRGVLILSETAGAASELAEALIVNPTDRDQIAQAIHRSLTMPVEEQVGRNEIMQNRIRNYDVVKWVDDFITQIGLHKKVQAKLKVKEVTQQIKTFISDKYKQSKKRLLLLDYDGTLSPFTRLPNLALPTDDILDVIRGLVEDKKNDVVLISGRTKDNLEAWFGSTNVNLVAEHGGFYKTDGSEWNQINPASIDWKIPLYPIFNFYLSRCAGTFLEEKELSLAWHYRNAEKDLGVLRARELINELREMAIDLDFQILEGNMVIEARSGNINKGIASQEWLSKTDYDFVMAIGDDKTDEDMFKVIPESGFSIKVGLTQSNARYNFRQQSDVPEFLLSLTQSEALSG